MALESCRSQGTLAVSGRCGASTSLRTRAHLRGGGLSGGGTTDRLPTCLTTLSVSTNVRQQKTPESSQELDHRRFGELAPGHQGPGSLGELTAADGAA